MGDRGRPAHCNRLARRPHSGDGMCAVRQPHPSRSGSSRCSPHTSDPPTVDSTARSGCLASWKGGMPGGEMRSGSERFLRNSNLRVKTSSETQRVGMRAPLSGTAPRRSTPSAAPESSPDLQQKRPARPLSASATAPSNTLRRSRLKPTSVVRRAMFAWPPGTAHQGEKPLDSDEFLAGFGRLGRLRAKTTLEPEVLSRRSLFRKDKTAHFGKPETRCAGGECGCEVE